MFKKTLIHSALQRLACCGVLFLFVVIPGYGQSFSENSKKDTIMEEKISDILQRMTLEEKVGLVHGGGYFETREIERLGIPSLKMCDGPHGVREGRATCFPTGVGMGATWNPALLQEVGRALAQETLAKGRNVILGPCINIHRTPLGGRNFESFSEDPYLSGALAVGYVKGVQGEGVGTSTKHFAANNQECDRMTISAEVSERALREIYWPAFERAVKEADTWTIMGAYNRLNGTYCCANGHLLDEVLKEEWGFRGLVVSDWGAVHGTEEFALHGLDLEMPGEGEWFGHGKLLEAVQSGRVPEEKIDGMVRRILRVLFLMGLDNPDNSNRPGALDTPEHRVLARRVAEESITLLKNEEGVLPLKGAVKRLAVIGPHASTGRVGGGGSSTVEPFYMISPLDGLRACCGEDVQVDYAPGMTIPCDYPPVSPAWFVPPDGHSEERGLLAEYFDNRELAGDPVVTRIEDTLAANWGPGSPDPLVPTDNFSARWTGWLVPEESGEYDLSLRSDDGSRLFLDNELVIDFWWDHGPECKTAKRFLEAGRRYAFRAEYYEALGDAQIFLCCQRTGRAVQDAVNLAAESDAVVLCVGLTAADEGEGRDKDSMLLPDDQEALIRAVSAVNSNTVVVLVGGTPIDMTGWIDDVRAVLMAWYPGQEGGSALANMLFGKVNPSGKLPMTLPRHLEDNPSFGHYPGTGKDGTVGYAEGLYVGYRHYDTRDVEPLFPFGHGLSYTTFEYGAPVMNSEQGTVSVEITNTGRVPGAETVQLYIRDTESTVDRPMQELKGFQKIFLKPGKKQTVTFRLNERSFAFWHPEKKTWVVEPGAFELRIGSSSRDIRCTAIWNASSLSGFGPPDC